ncbi:hypothetical protein BC830DRAFT_1172349 [Chytriomyces sp. MP71]|nr:hypothetical protein BC830DRAFT_1172349 [Chytriomyces sp. MP71]
MTYKSFYVNSYFVNHGAFHANPYNSLKQYLYGKGVPNTIREPYQLPNVPKAQFIAQHGKLLLKAKRESVCILAEIAKSNCSPFMAAQIEYYAKINLSGLPVKFQFPNSLTEANFEERHRAKTEQHNAECAAHEEQEQQHMEALAAAAEDKNQWPFVFIERRMGAKSGKAPKPVQNRYTAPGTLSLFDELKPKTVQKSTSVAGTKVAQDKRPPPAPHSKPAVGTTFRDSQESHVSATQVTTVAGSLESIAPMNGDLQQND